MKNLTLSTVALLLISYSASAKAKIPVCFPCEYIETTQDLPAETEFVGETGDPLNIGYKYEQINILWIPIWNYDGGYFLVNDAEDTYYDLTEEDKAYLKENNDASFEGSPLSIWNKMGGKAILLIILILVIWGYLPSRNKEETSESERTS